MSLSPTETARIQIAIENALAERFGAGPDDASVLLNGPRHVQVIVDGAHGHFETTIYLAEGRDITHVAAIFGIHI